MRLHYIWLYIFSDCSLKGLWEVSKAMYESCDLANEPIRQWSPPRDGGETVVWMASGRSYFFIDSVAGNCLDGSKMTVGRTMFISLPSLSLPPFISSSLLSPSLPSSYPPFLSSSLPLSLPPFISSSLLSPSLPSSHPPFSLPTSLHLILPSLSLPSFISSSLLSPFLTSSLPLSLPHFISSSLPTSLHLSLPSSIPPFLSPSLLSPYLPSSLPPFLYPSLPLSLPQVKVGQVQVITWQLDQTYDETTIAEGTGLLFKWSAGNHHNVIEMVSPQSTSPECSFVGPSAESLGKVWDTS